ncbi:class II aldolase/adducin family protein [Bacteriovoracales bacterium]|nr:class II aldolase/adducin family protein [Bacteriovoracales bacterium]
MTEEKEAFLKMSKMIGERFDLIQAAGGNTSVKLSDGSMLIKASGHALSDMDYEKGFAKINYKKLENIFENEEIKRIDSKREKEKKAKLFLSEVVAENSPRPSIETFMHCLLFKYTLHAHPILVNSLACRSDAELIFSELFPESLFIEYKTPGIELSLEIFKKIESYRGEKNKLPHLVFLKNHGVIISNDNPDILLETCDYVNKRVEDYLSVDFSRYRMTNYVSEKINKFSEGHMVSMISDDKVIIDLLSSNPGLINEPPFCPDDYVYFGFRPLKVLEDLNEEIENYLRLYKEVPKVLYFQGEVYCIAKNVKKAKEVEEVFKFHLLALLHAKKNIEFLNKEELHYLANWEAEKFRKNL